MTAETLEERVQKARKARGGGDDVSKAFTPDAHNVVATDEAATTPGGDSIVQAKLRIRNCRANQGREDDDDERSKLSRDESSSGVEPRSNNQAATIPSLNGGLVTSGAPTHYTPSSSHSSDEEDRVAEMGSALIQAELVENEAGASPSVVVTAQPLEKGPKKRTWLGLVCALVVVVVIVAVSVSVTRPSSTTTASNSTTATTPNTVVISDGGRDHSLHVAFVRPITACAETLHVTLSCGGNKIENILSPACVADGKDRSAECDIATNVTHVLAFECSVKETVELTDTIEIASMEVQLSDPSTEGSQCTDSVELGLYRYCVDDGEEFLQVRPDTFGMDSESAFSSVSECTTDSATLHHTCTFEQLNGLMDDDAVVLSFPTIFDNGLPECVLGEKKLMQGFEDFLVGYDFP